MPEHNLFQIFVSPLNSSDIPYFVTGAVAGIVYGEPRLTNDIDLVVELRDVSADRFVKIFPLKEFYCPPIEIIKLELGRELRGHFNIIHHKSAFKADVYIAGQDELHHWAMSNKKILDMGGKPICLAPPEYVILRKLEYYREGKSEKHLRDILSMVEISSDQIDFKVLREKVETYHLEKEWDMISRQK